MWDEKHIPTNYFTKAKKRCLIFWKSAWLSQLFHHHLKHTDDCVNIWFKWEKIKARQHPVLFPPMTTVIIKQQVCTVKVGERARYGCCVHVVGTEFTETLRMSFKDKWTSNCADTAWAHLISSSGECHSTLLGQIRCAGMWKSVCVCVRVCLCMCVRVCTSNPAGDVFLSGITSTQPFCHMKTSKRKLSCSTSLLMLKCLNLDLGLLQELFDPHSYTQSALF